VGIFSDGGDESATRKKRFMDMPLSEVRLRRTLEEYMSNRNTVLPLQIINMYVYMYQSNSNAISSTPCPFCEILPIKNTNLSFKI
jgi:hypothetical protein